MTLLTGPFHIEGVEKVANGYVVVVVVVILLILVLAFGKK